MKNFKASLLVGALFLSVSNGASAIQPGVYKYVPSLLCETGDVAVKQNVNQKPMFSVGTSEAGALRLEIEKQSLSAYSDLGVAYFEQISRSQEYGFNEADTLEVEGEQVTYGSHSFLLHEEPMTALEAAKLLIPTLLDVRKQSHYAGRFQKELADSKQEVTVRTVVEMDEVKHPNRIFLSSFRSDVVKSGEVIVSIDHFENIRALLHTKASRWDQTTLSGACFELEKSDQ
ncbi:hypothetical protein WE348_23120 (plasmid) [Alteromonas macleodii]|uniref:hypothetical protein n=1 Tax=Alteromonas macleodii TaxID=28108 RepID=UPI0030D56951